MNLKPSIVYNYSNEQLNKETGQEIDIRPVFKSLIMSLGANQHKKGHIKLKLICKKCMNGRFLLKKIKNK